MTGPGIALNGPRTLVSRCAGSITFGDANIPPLLAFVPSVPNGMVSVPLTSLPCLLGGEEPADTAVRDLKKALKTAGSGAVDQQVLLTEELGCISTVSSGTALGLIEAVWSKDAADQFQPLLEQLADAARGTDGAGGDLARFESLSRLHHVAGRPRGRAPGHWHHQRGREEAAASSGKGVWRTEAGEWMASHALATSYAQWLFPAFMVWTMDLIFDDPVSRWRLEGVCQSIFGGRFVVAEMMPPPSKARSHLRLVRDDTQPNDGVTS